MWEQKTVSTMAAPNANFLIVSMFLLLKHNFFNVALIDDTLTIPCLHVIVCFDSFDSGF
jgi:hypothetical protein